MRNIDFDPFWRSSIGFDRLFAMIDEALEPEDRYPPYNILRTGEEAYRVSLAVAGFPPGQISVTRTRTADRRGTAVREGRQGRISLSRHRGAGVRKRFNLADYVEVEGASFEDGLLHIDLVRRVPEAMKPRRIEVGVKTTPPKAGTPRPSNMRRRPE